MLSADEQLVLQAANAIRAKRGRVLSSENETELRRARDILDGVLAKVAVAPESKEDTPPTCCSCSNPAQSGCVHGDCTHTVCDLHRNQAGFCPHHGDENAIDMPRVENALVPANEIVIMLDEPESAVVLMLDDGDAPGAARIAVTPEDLHAAMRDAFGSLRGDVSEIVRRETAAAFNRARGRVD